MFIELQLFLRVAVVTVADLVFHHRNLHVAEKCAEVHWTFPKEEVVLFDNAGDDPRLSVLYRADVLCGEDKSSNRKEFTFHSFVPPRKVAARAMFDDAQRPELSDFHSSFLVVFAGNILVEWSSHDYPMMFRAATFTSLRHTLSLGWEEEVVDNNEREVGNKNGPQDILNLLPERLHYEAPQLVIDTKNAV